MFVFNVEGNVNNPACVHCGPTLIPTLASLQQFLLDPHRLLLLVQDALFDDPDEVIDPGPGLGFNAGVETGDGLQLFLLRPAQPQQLLLRLQAKRQLPVWTGNRKETVLLVVTLVAFRTRCV